MRISNLKLIDRALGYVIDLLFKSRSYANESNCSQPNKILIIKLSAMGDALCMMPAIRQLSDSFPNTTITWLTTSRSNPDIFLRLLFIETILVLPTQPFAAVYFLSRMLLNSKTYDLIIDFDQYYRTSELLSLAGRKSAGFITPIKGRKHSISITYNALDNEKHLFRLLVEAIVSRYGKEFQPYRFSLPELLNGFKPSKHLREWCNQVFMRSNNVLILYPGSSPNATYRRWSWEYYLELTKLLDSSQYTIIFAGGPSELELKNDLIDSETNVYDCIGMWKLLEWYWIFLNYKPIFCSSDAGLHHLADIAGVPTITLFGPTRSGKWGSIRPDAVFIEQIAYCRPCINTYLGDVPDDCWRNTRECLTLVKPQLVATQIEHLSTTLVSSHLNKNSSSTIL